MWRCRDSLLHGLAEKDQRLEAPQAKLNPVILTSKFIDSAEVFNTLDIRVCPAGLLAKVRLSAIHYQGLFHQK